MDISIIIPVYNVDIAFFHECLDSVIAQNMSRIEVIIADDGSTDNSGAVADEYAASHPEFKVIHLEHGGPGRARNIALTYATGKYIFFLDADDKLVPGILEKMLCRARHDRSDVTICNVARFNSANIYDSYIHRRAFRDLDGLTDVRKSPSLLYDTVSWNKLIKRSFWERNRISYPEGILYEDIPSMTHVYLAARRVSVIRTTGYLWRVRDGESRSTTQRRMEHGNLQDRLTALRIRDRLFREKVSDQNLDFEKQVKTLKLDLKLYINLCVKQSREEAEQYAKEIREYIEEEITQEAIGALNSVDQEIYKALIANNIDRLIQLVVFRKKTYPERPVIEKNERLLMKADPKLFRESYIDVTDSAKYRFPVLRLKTAEHTADDNIKISAYMFFPMINMPDAGWQKVRAYLLNEYTGRETELKVSNGSNEWMDDEDCTVGTAFDIYLDPVMIRNSQKDAVILIKYSNKFTRGTEILKNTVSGADDVISFSIERYPLSERIKVKLNR